MRSIRGVIAGAMLLGLAGLTVDARAQSCQKDNDCPGDLVCNAGQCQTLSGATPSPAATPTPAAEAQVTSVSAAPAPAAGLVPVQFTGPPVTVLDTSSKQQCVVPCTMHLVPGNHTFTMGNFMTQIVVSAPGGTYEVKPGDQGMILGGAITTGLGATAVIAGGVFMLVGSDSSSDSSSYSSTDESSSDLSSVGKPLLLAGLPVLTLGIVLLASAEKPDMIKTAAVPRSSGMPMVGVAPTPGGALLGATMAF